MQLDEISDPNDYCASMTQDTDLDRIMEVLSVQFDLQARRQICEEINGQTCICECHTHPNSGNKLYRETLTEDEEFRVFTAFMKRINDWYNYQRNDSFYT